MGLERREVTIEWTDHYLRPCVRPGRRSGRYIWLDDEVPGLRVGGSGRFVIERERRKGATWRVVGPA